MKIKASKLRVKLTKGIPLKIKPIKVKPTSKVSLKIKRTLIPVKNILPKKK